MNQYMLPLLHKGTTGHRLPTISAWQALNDLCGKTWISPIIRTYLTTPFAASGRSNAEATEERKLQ